MLILWKRRIAHKICRIFNAPFYVRQWMVSKHSRFGLTMKTLFHNNLMDFTYFLEILLEPMIWIVDHFTKILGPILVCGVILLTGSIVSIVYVIGFPYYIQYYPILVNFLMVLGHWLLINVVFHFYQAASIDPGTPPRGILLTEAVSVCKKCIAPKPPRTHHCSVCNRCVLKMDHHCPWLNRCVGHYNHRHFFMYLIYMILGILFIMIFGFEIAHYEIWQGGEYGGGLREAMWRYWQSADSELDEGEDIDDGFPVRVNGTHIIPVIGDELGEPMLLEAPPTENPHIERKNYWYRFSIMYAAMLLLGGLISLTALSVWHGRLITRGETSIEAHINKKETERLQKINQEYKNPYDYGARDNWKVFLGLCDGRSMRHLILPSRHLPAGTGLTWPNSIILAANHDKAA